LKTGAILLCLACLLLSLFSCGSDNPQQPTTSQVKPRVFISNSVGGILQIIDAGKDTLVAGHSISVGSRPGLMALAPNKKFTLVFNAGANSISLVDNAQETQTVTIPLPSFTESMAIAPNSEVAYIALPAATVLGQPAGVLEIIGFLNNQVRATVNIPRVHHVVVSHDSKRLLAFSDGSDSVTVLDADGNVLAQVSGFDRPVWGVFSEDDGRAFILNCGSECGGSNASVSVLNMSNNTVGSTVGLAGATFAVLNSGSLYVAGSASGNGTLQVVNGSNLSASAPVTISDGFHDRMEFAADNKLFVGARGCNNIQTGCLSIFDTSAKTAVIDTPNGDVTGIQPIADRNLVYVVEGGELRIFDTTTSAPSTKSFIDIVGQLIDVKEVD
jgi:DNA-binding beta-propeller fold protein YncE